VYLANDVRPSKGLDDALRGQIEPPRV